MVNAAPVADWNGLIIGRCFVWRSIFDLPAASACLRLLSSWASRWRSALSACIFFC